MCHQTTVPVKRDTPSHDPDTHSDTHTQTIKPLAYVPLSG